MEIDRSLRSAALRQVFTVDGVGTAPTVQVLIGAVKNA